MPKILIVEDDPTISRMVADWLSHQRFEVEMESTGRDAIHRLKTYQYDLVVLDLGLPDLEGFDVLDATRNAGNDVPVLILTGKRSVDDKERGLLSGADDYLTKPFDMREFNARVKALLRRPRQIVPAVLTFRGVELDTVKHSATRDGAALKLTPKEFALLEFLMRHPNQVFSAEALLDRVWRSDTEITEEAIVTCIRRLRKRIDENDAEFLIRTIYGVGYMLVGDS